MNLSQAKQQSENICQQSGSNFTLATRFLSKDASEALRIFYAYCRVLDDIVDESGSASEAQAQLDFWKTELERVYQGSPQSSVGIALAPVVKNFLVPQTYLEEIRLGCEMDLNKNRYANFAELEQYCYRVASCVGISCLYFFQLPPNELNIETAVNLGKALQFTNILRDIKEDFARNRVYLPQELLQKYNLSEDDFTNWQAAKSKWLLCLNDFIRLNKNFYQAAFEAIKENESKKWLPALLMAKTYQAILDKIAPNPLIVFEKRVRVSKLQKLFIVSKLLWKNRSKKS